MGRKAVTQDVPEEAIAEGSGPHEASELADAAEQVLAEPEGPPDMEALAGDGGGGGDGDDGGDGDNGIAAGEPAELPVALDDATLENLVEALVFAADKPVTIQRLRQLTRCGDVRRIEAALAALGERYTARGMVLQSVSGGYQFRTATEFSKYVQQLVAGRPVRLSRAQLETLAIVAYRQPITRPEIDDIRGVDSSNTLRVLAERSLVRILGKKEEVGRPLLYGTTKEFLDFFSLADLRELPTLREYSELTDESRQVMSDKLGPDDDAAGRPSAPVDAAAIAPEPAHDPMGEPDVAHAAAVDAGEPVEAEAPDTSSPVE
jgi:segregation and condensation protein B